MEICSQKGCNKPAERYLGKVRISLKDDWKQSLWLCEEHAKEFIKKYGIGGEE